MAIRLVPPDPDWADIYERAAADIRGALGSTALSVDHVGSTAIPGIVAKPVIDVEILVEAYDTEAPYRGPLESLGYAFDHRDENHVFFMGVVRRNSAPCACRGGVLGVAHDDQVPRLPSSAP